MAPRLIDRVWPFEPRYPVRRPRVAALMRRPHRSRGNGPVEWPDLSAFIPDRPPFIDWSALDCEQRREVVEGMEAVAEGYHRAADALEEIDPGMAFQYEVAALHWDAAAKEGRQALNDCFRPSV